MRKPKHLKFVTLALLALAGAGVCGKGWGGPALQPADVSGIAALEAAFRNPPEDAKIMVRWWWFGPAVTTAELDREMRDMKEAGIGGFEVQPVYPLTLDDPAHGLTNLRYLSPEFLAAVSSTARTAHELGLRMDMTMGSGWPFGGPHITSDLAAEKLRCLRIPIKEGQKTVPAPQLQIGQRFLGAFMALVDPTHPGGFNLDRIPPQADGSFQLPSLPELDVSEREELMVFVAEMTGQQVKRAAVGAEGNVLDHYSRPAIEKHLEAVGAPLLAAGGGYIRAMFCDSLEVYQSDWTRDFVEEFKRRRGYDLTFRLGELMGDDGTITRLVRRDWAQTLSELLNENFLEPYQEWCHRHNVLARVQAYGEPPAKLSSYRYVDLPEGEQGDEAGHWNHFTASRWASSAGHLYGAPVISAEAWTWLHKLAFRATPLDFKATADKYFLEGINQFVAHGYPYSPPGVPEPGWHFYAAGALGPHNPWWFAMPDLARYLQRGSFMLRQGRPANDIAVYLPTHDALARLTLDNVNLWKAIWRQLGQNLLPSLLEAGYNLDFIDDETLAQQGRVEKGNLIFAGQAFSVVVLPGIERIPPTTLAKLGEFAKSGGTLIATRRLPAGRPGFGHEYEGSVEVTRQVDELFKKPSAPGHFVSDENRPLEDELTKLYPPDVAFSLRSKDIGFIHRHTDTEEIYFIANTSNRRFQGTATFRVKGKNGEWWNLFTGEVTPALVASESNAVLKLDIEPYGSRLVVFTDRQAPKEPHRTEARLLPSIDLSRGWEVEFEGAGRDVSLDGLRSWTLIDGLKYFSGHATYRTSFAPPAMYFAEGVRTVLNFGEGTPLEVDPKAHFQAWLDGPVREAAEVFINGRRAGTVWHPPYEVDVTTYLRAGANELRIVVGNLAVNEMAGHPLPDRSQLTARYGERFQDQGNELVMPVPSGLTGPIRLIARENR